MPIGTAAPTAAQLQAVPHHLVGFLDPRERYSAAAFVRDALGAIDDILARGKQPIVAGGTGFYIRALAGDVALAGARDEILRARVSRAKRLSTRRKSCMHGWLRSIPRVLLRSILPTAIASRARSKSRLRKRSDAGPIEVERRLAALGAHTVRQDLSRRSDCGSSNRASKRGSIGCLEQGLLEEAERFGDDVVAADAVGYPQANAYLRGQATRKELRMHLIRATRRYAKRQETWFRSEPDVERVRPEDAREFVLARMKAWL